MATRTVRDCDRCGQRDIQEDQVSKHLCTGTRVDIDLCTSCKAAMFAFVVRQLDDPAVVNLEKTIRTHCVSVVHIHGATPNDMRP